MPRLALLSRPYFQWSMDAYGGLYDETQALTRALASHGVETHLVNWSHNADALQDYDAIWLQTYAGYEHHADAFLEMLQQLDTAGIPCLNSSSLVRWNMHKHYLQALETTGIPVLPTLYANTHDKTQFQTLVKQQGWDEVVAKPAVSAGAWHTARLHATDTHGWQRYISELPDATDMLIQPFAPEIVTDGEWSLLFFQQRFSHAVRKTAKTGDFRIQHVHGGSYEHIKPEQALLDQAMRALQALPESPLYARVDGIRRNGQLLIMEIELIEPFLYLLPEPQHAENAARAIAAELETLTRQPDSQPPSLRSLIGLG